MRRGKKSHWIYSAATLLAAAAPMHVSAETVLHDKDVVAVCGDSITEQKIYSVFIETYLLACKPKADLKADQIGWSGEQAIGFLPRIGSDVLPLHPTVATTCYGMNDGHYTALTPEAGAAFRDAMKGSVDALKAGGVRTVIVGGPGCVDTQTFKKPNVTAAGYNETLGALSDIARDIAKEKSQPFADVHGEMMRVMTAAKEKYGEKFPFAGGDGIHPQQAGHLVMAYSYLKAMGCNGDVGTITLDFTGKDNRASAGHRILSAGNNTVEIESTRYPFCFLGDGKSASSEKSVVSLFPFNADLNRFTLVVKNLGPGQVKVTWGDQSKNFSAEPLGSGINLAAEFIDDNPFIATFTELEKAVAAQQAFETPLTKALLHGAPDIKKTSPDATAALAEFEAAAIKFDNTLFAMAAKKASTPVHHTIKVELVP